jgi:TonB family protein
MSETILERLQPGVFVLGPLCVLAFLIIALIRGRQARAWLLPVTIPLSLLSVTCPLIVNAILYIDAFRGMKTEATAGIDAVLKNSTAAYEALLKGVISLVASLLLVALVYWIVGFIGRRSTAPPWKPAGSMGLAFSLIAAVLTIMAAVLLWFHFDVGRWITAVVAPIPPPKMIQALEATSIETVAGKLGTELQVLSLGGMWLIVLLIGSAAVSFILLFRRQPARAAALVGGCIAIVAVIGAAWSVSAIYADLGEIDRALKVTRLGTWQNDPAMARLEASVSIPARTELAVFLDGQRKLQINNEPCQMSDLEGRLQEIFSARVNKKVILIGDSGLPFGAMAKLIRAAWEPGADPVLLFPDGAFGIQPIQSQALTPSAVVAVDEGQKILVNSRAVRAEDLEREVRAEVAAKRDGCVYVLANVMASYSTVAEALSHVRRAGPREITLFLGGDIELAGTATGTSSPQNDQWHTWFTGMILAAKQWEIPPPTDEPPVVGVSGVVGGIPGGIIGGIIGGLPAGAPPPPPPPPRPRKADPVRVGANVQESKILRKVDPVYPELAKRARVAQMVTLEVIVDEEGNVTSVNVKKGHPLLDQAATDAVKQWKYSPTLLNGYPVPVITTVTVIFKLDK